jgi:hypothetical protein
MAPPDEKKITRRAPAATAARSTWTVVEWLRDSAAHVDLGGQVEDRLRALSVDDPAQPIAPHVQLVEVG